MTSHTDGIDPPIEDQDLDSDWSVVQNGPQQDLAIADAEPETDSDTQESYQLIPRPPHPPFQRKDWTVTFFVYYRDFPRRPREFLGLAQTRGFKRIIFRSPHHGTVSDLHGVWEHEYNHIYRTWQIVGQFHCLGQAYLERRLRADSTVNSNGTR